EAAASGIGGMVMNLHDNPVTDSRFAYSRNSANPTWERGRLRAGEGARETQAERQLKGCRTAPAPEVPCVAGRALRRCKAPAGELREARAVGVSCACAPQAGRHRLC